VRRQHAAYLYAAAAVLCWSTVASAFKTTLRHADVLQLLLVSSCTSLIVLLGIVAARGDLKRYREWSRADLGKSALLGFLNPGLYYLVLFRAYFLLPAQEAQSLNYTWPVVLVLFSIVFLRQRIRLISLVALLISFAGAFIISTRGDVTGLTFTDTEGIFLALGSTLIWSAYWTLNIKDKKEPVARLALNFTFGCAYIIVYLLLFHGISLPGPAGIVGSMYTGVFEMGITFVFWLQALRLSSSTAQVSGLVYLTPFLSLVVIHFVVGEEIFPSTAVGLGLIVAGIVLQQYGGGMIDRLRTSCQ